MIEEFLLIGEWFKKFWVFKDVNFTLFGDLVLIITIASLFVIGHLIITNLEKKDI